MKKGGNNRSLLSGRSLVFLLYIFLAISGLYIIISESTAQQDDDWIWSVKVKDIEGLDRNYVPDSSHTFYMINDSVNVSWTIIPSRKSTIIDTMLRVYPKGADKSKYKPYPIIIPPNAGSRYVQLVDTSFLSSISPKNKIYSVEVNATAIDNSSGNSTQVNEWHTHEIEINVTNPGTLVIQKTIPGWDDADLSGWQFRVTGPADTKITSTIEKATDNSGKAVFSELRPGTYSIEEVSRDGWRQIPLRNNVKVEPGQSNPQEFVNTPNILTIIKKDSVGHPLSGWVFKVQGSKETVVTKPTDSSGITEVKGLPSGEYNIQEESSMAGWRRTSPDQDLSIRFGSGEPKSVVLTNAEEGSIRIAKKDSEGNPLAGWSFTVTGPDSKTVVTDSNGLAVAEGLLPGEYTVREIQQSKWTNVTNSERKVTLNPGEDKQLEPFINAAIIPLTIVKFNDKNRNGRLDRDASGSPLENGLSGWTYIVEGPGGFKAVGPTDAAGIATVDLTPGVYTVTEDISASNKPGWICTTSNPQTVKISRGAANMVEFGNKANKLTLIAFNDSSMNGKREGNENGLAGWTFVLKGPNEVSNPPAITTMPTDADGAIALDGLSPGSYSVTENLADGWINTSPTSTTVQILAGEEKQVEFGNIKPSRIEIFKFNDTNKNGKLDAGENGLPGWSFRVDGPGGLAGITNPTNAEGITVVDGLIPGEYVITEPQVDRWLSITPRIQNRVIGFGDSQRVTFANYYCERCFTINDQPKINNSTDQNLVVIKEVSDISAESIMHKNGYPVNYNIKLCPSRGIERIAAVPTDIVIAVDNSRSLSNINESSILAVQALVDGISKNDRQKITRLGLVSWSDKGFSKIQVPLTNDYNSVASAAKNIVFPEGDHTDYQEAINSSLLAFHGKESDASRTKKIVIITDANDSGYIAPSNVPGPDYTIYAIVVGNNIGITPYEMLDSLTRNHQGYIRSINNISELQEALIQMVTAGSRIRNVHLVETLPNYLILNNGTAEDDSGKIQINGDSNEWTTTTISWDVGDLSGCWNTTFQAFFCWKLPADVNQPKLTSYVNYTDDKGVERTILLPEYEINIVPSSGQGSQVAPVNGETKTQPGFEALLAAMGISIAGYLYRRRDA